MNFSKLQSQLIDHEGLKDKPYTDTTGHLTIGIGHNLDKGLTKDQILYIFKDDVEEAINLLKSSFPWFDRLDDVRQRAMIDLAFNLGSKLLSFNTFISLMSQSKFADAADDLLTTLWAKQVKRRADHLSYMIKTGLDYL